MSDWLNLRRDIVDIFIDAQRIAVERVRAIRVARVDHDHFVHRRDGFNVRSPGGNFYARQRAVYTRYVIPILEPPDDPSLLCGCGYRAYTQPQLRNHRRLRRCPDHGSSQK